MTYSWNFLANAVFFHSLWGAEAAGVATATRQDASTAVDPNLWRYSVMVHSRIRSQIESEPLRRCRYAP